MFEVRHYQSFKALDYGRVSELLGAIHGEMSLSLFGDGDGGSLREDGEDHNLWCRRPLACTL